jgi:hypothetical protein
MDDATVAVIGFLAIVATATTFTDVVYLRRPIVGVLSGMALSLAIWAIFAIRGFGHDIFAFAMFLGVLPLVVLASAIVSIAFDVIRKLIANRRSSNA